MHAAPDCCRAPLLVQRTHPPPLPPLHQTLCRPQAAPRVQNNTVIVAPPVFGGFGYGMPFFGGGFGFGMPM